MSNSKSAFDKWSWKEGFADLNLDDASFRGWLAALKWALRQKYKDGKGQTYGCMDNVVLDTKKIKAEIKKASKK